MTCREAGPLFLRQACPGAGPAADVAPGDVPASYARALAEQAAGRGGRAIAELRATSAASYRHPFAAVLLAHHLSRAGRGAEAQEAWRSAGASEGETLLLRAGTVETCTSAAALTGNGARASFCLGVRARNDRDFDAAMTWFRRAEAGSVRVEADDFPELAAERSVDRGEVLYRMAEVELTRGRTAEAQRLNDACLAERPEHYWCRLVRALLVAEKDPRAAIQDLEALVARHPGHGAALFHLGRLHGDAGDLAAARRWLGRAREALPDPTLAERELRRLDGSGKER